MSRPVARHPRHDFLQLDPVPAADDLSAFYESRYYDLIRRGGRAPDVERLTAKGPEAERERTWLRATLYADLAEIMREHAPGRRVLDVGAGSGDAVAYLGEQGFAAEGIDPADSPAAHARRLGLAVHTVSLEAWAADPARAGAYDGLYLLNVLEHVPDPEATVDAVRTLLAPGGLLVVRVPNDFSALQQSAMAATGRTEPWWVTAPDHVNYFDMRSLEAFFRACGFDPLHRTADWPMELFLLMGEDYLATPGLGAVLHERRRRMELAMPAPLRRAMQGALAGVGIGRNVMVAGRKRA